MCVFISNYWRWNVVGGRGYSCIYCGACVTVLLSEVIYSADNNSVCAKLRKGQTASIPALTEQMGGGRRNGGSLILVRLSCELQVGFSALKADVI